MGCLYSIKDKAQSVLPVHEKEKESKYRNVGLDHPQSSRFQVETPTHRLSYTGVQGRMI